MLPLKKSSETFHRISNTLNWSNLLLIVLIACLCCCHSVGASTHSVQTYRTSSTQLGQLMTSSTLNWESYVNDKKQLEFSIKGGSFVDDDVHYPIYVCRSTVEGLYVSGHTERRGSKLVCVVSLLGEVKTHHAFDVLVNKGHLGKVGWKSWRKFNAATPIGAVSVSSNEVTYVARHRNGKHSHHNHESNELQGADYSLGRFDPSMGLGKILVAESDYEKDYDDGEILVETEPIRYELKNIKLDKFRSDTKVNTTELGSAVLSNVGDRENLVETVISFKYDRTQYWGAHEGVARGLPTRIYDAEKVDSVPDEVNWGLRYSEMRVETKTVSTNLPPGTALNVTLKGNYTSLEAPYSATLIAYYNGSDEKVSRKISSTVQKSNLRDIKLEFSPVYWIENGTFIPTTTTTTTTSTTTEPTTTSTKEPKPLTEPQIVVGNIGKSLFTDTSSSSSSGSGGDLSSELDNRSNMINHSGEVEKLKDPKNGNSAGVRSYSNFGFTLIISFIIGHYLS